MEDYYLCPKMLRNITYRLVNKHLNCVTLSDHSNIADLKEMFNFKDRWLLLAHSIQYACTHTHTPKANAPSFAAAKKCSHTKHNFFLCNHLYINFLQRPLLCLWANLSKKSDLKINKTNFYNEVVKSVPRNRTEENWKCTVKILSEPKSTCFQNWTEQQAMGK